ncbi:DUF3455 domain-containing protein [Mangrovihabitans endophyticus]|uniref:DUF3455 domain-containing protein n=1 Tax=Mangrovihabitans endophyticus TaxID=1751298 RepID=A0A8J3FPM7_9ACTN|nr:DUF3455 domain-containing protein [Mangrovihabitans endophyticus]GGL00566.1 hypothetical protein GCM10012284_38790 [Mangrovihabitans endophyticus]
MSKRIGISAGVGALALTLVGVSATMSFAGETPADVAGKAAGTRQAAAASGPAGTAASGTAAERAAAAFLGGVPAVPETLKPPAGNVVNAVYTASGVQVYGCTDGAWTLVEPAANLTGITVQPVRKVSAIHFRGPSWESAEDGSLVEGMSPVSAPSDTPNSIPQLLVTKKLTRGTGVFGAVTYIQRLSTVGGIAPAGGCAADATAGVPYRAVYRFFVAGQ